MSKPRACTGIITSVCGGYFKVQWNIFINPTEVDMFYLGESHTHNHINVQLANKLNSLITLVAVAIFWKQII